MCRGIREGLGPDCPSAGPEHVDAERGAEAQRHWPRVLAGSGPAPIPPAATSLQATSQARAACSATPGHLQPGAWLASRTACCLRQRPRADCWLRRHNGRSLICHETIYRFVYLSSLGQQERLWEYLRRAKKRRTHRPGRRSQQSPIPNRVFIEQRPVEAQERREVGRWESDSLLYPHGQALNVLVDRFSRFTLVAKLEGRTAEATSTALTQRLASRPVHSLTADNGSENVNHQIVSQTLGVAFFFCHPYHWWEKGTVENMNGLIRRYLPRRTDLRPTTQEELDQIADELNHRPRKCLHYQTPLELLSLHPVGLGTRILGHHAAKQSDASTCGPGGSQRCGDDSPSSTRPFSRRMNPRSLINSRMR